MEHGYIEEHNLADHYLLGHLSAEQEAQFEAHLINCPECLDRLELTERFRRGLKLVMPQDAARSRVYAKPGVLGWIVGFPLRWQAVALLAAMVLVAVLPSIFFLREIQRQRHELAQARLALTQRQPESQPPAAGPLEQRLRELEQQLAEQRQRFESELEREQQARAQLTDAVDRLTRPRANIPTFTLSLVRSADPSQPQPVNNLIIPPSSEWIVLSLEVDGASEYETYRATLVTADNRRVWRESGLQPTPQETVVISFHSSFFRAGEYRFILEGITPQGRVVPVGRYPFRVIKEQQ
jgi:hypothetical protein